MDKSRISCVIALAAILSHGHAVAQSTQGPGVSTTETQSLRMRVPVKITAIPLMDSRINIVHMAFLGGIAASEGAVWADTNQGTLRLDPQTHQAVTTPSPARGVGLLVGEGSLWSSGGNVVNWGMPASKETLTLHRIDPKTHQVIASIDAAGDAFAAGGGKIWALNPQTRTIVIIDAKTNQVVDTITTERKGQLALGGGAIWQLSGKGEKLGEAEVVRRIDPQTKSAVAEIPVGPYSYATIRFIEGAIWIVGPRGQGVGIVERIDVSTNRVVATIRVQDRAENARVLERGALGIDVCHC